MSADERPDLCPMCKGEAYAAKGYDVISYTCDHRTMAETWILQWRWR